MNDTPFITVAICTFNRAELLDSVLRTVLKLDSSYIHEVLIIDNGSKDKTREIVRSWASNAKVPVGYVYEGQPGIAHARNRALREGHGQYLAFLDDDAWPNPDWLNELMVPVHSIVPRPACVVGKVELEWEGKQPPWLPSFMEPLLCAYDLGPHSRFLTKDEYLLTTNVLFHRQTALKLGGFRPYLGRRRGQMLGGEDNDMHYRLVHSGNKVFYQPQAVVRHWVPHERQTKWFVIRRIFWDGASQPLLDFSRAELFGEQYPARKHILPDLKRSLKFTLNLAFPFRQHKPAFERFLILLERLGRLRTHILMASQHKKW